eukprot:jgi/Bigna1/56505/estExt_Genewise1Plus.C_1010014
MKPVHVLEGHESLINSCSFSKDGRLLVSSSADGTVRLWHAASGEQVASFEGHDGMCEGMLQNFAVSPDGTKILCNMDDECVLLSTIGRSRIVVLEGHEGTAKSLSFSEDGSAILTSSTDGSVKQWDTNTGKLVTSYDGHTDSVWKAVFSPSNMSILSCSADKSLRVWERETGKVSMILKGHNSPVHLCSYSPNGKWIVSASKDKEIIIWSAEGEEFARLSGHKSYIWSVECSPDSMLLLSTSCDGEMILWSLPHGKRLGTLSGHKEGVKSCSFSPSGTALASASHDNTLMLWNISGCHYQKYLGALTQLLDNRLNHTMPNYICKIMAEYTWPDLVEELDIEEEFSPEEDSRAIFAPVQRRRIKSCKF